VLHSRAPATFWTPTLAAPPDEGVARSGRRQRIDLPSCVRVGMRVPLNPRSTDVAKTPGAGSPVGPKPSCVLDATTFGPSTDRARPVSRSPRVATRLQPSVSGPPNPSPPGIGSLPAFHRLVPYRLDTKRTLRQAGELAVFNGGRTLASLTRRRDALGEISFARTLARQVPPRRPRNSAAARGQTRSRTAKHIRHFTSTHRRMPCQVATTIPPEGCCRGSLSGRVRSGQSDIEATSGVDLVLPRGRLPQHARVSIQADSPVTPHGSNGPRSTLPTSHSRLAAVR
jgi:hypothetical protein